MSSRRVSKNGRALLVHYVQELERLEEERAAAAEALKAGFKAAAAAGFDRDTLRVVLKLRKLSPSQRRERRALEAIYLASLGMLDGDPLPDEARRRLDDQDKHPQSTPPDPPTAATGTTQPPAKPQGPGQLPMQLKDPGEARAEGRAAAAAKKRIFDNPYPRRRSVSCGVGRGLV